MAQTVLKPLKTLFFDGLQSLVSNLGNPERDKSASTSYYNATISDETILAIFRSSWIARKCVKIPANDAFRRWREWHGDKDDIKAVEQYEINIKARKKLQRAMTRARLWGGAAVLMVTDQPLDQPLDVTRIRKGELKMLNVFSRLDLKVEELEDDPRSEYYGKPRFYILPSKNTPSDDLVIHPSHLILFDGEEPADEWVQVGPNFGWGDSVIQSTYDSIKNADSTSANMASLVFEANVDVFGVPDLMERLGTPEYEDRLLKRFALANAAKGVNKALIHDSMETYDRKQLNFSELPAVLEIFLKMCAGALDIPMTRFMGDSPSGLNSTGEGDMKNYYDRVTSEQTLEITPAIQRYDEVLIRSALGSRPDTLWYKWSPLEQMNTRQVSEIAKLYSETLRFLKESQILLPEELRQIAISQFTEYGIFPGIEAVTDKLPPEQFQEAMLSILEKIAEATAAKPEGDRQSPANTTRNSNNTATNKPVRVQPDEPGPNS